MLRKILCALIARVLAEKPPVEEIEPGVFHIPLEKVFFDEHPQLEAAHPRVGNWSDSELWNQEVKLPIRNSDLSNYMYVMDCTIGSGDQTSNKCILDSTTSLSSTFYK